MSPPAFQMLSWNQCDRAVAEAQLSLAWVQRQARCRAEARGSPQERDVGTGCHF